MRVLFAGTPDIAVPSLEVLNRNHEVVGVLTNPDRGCGRGREIKCCPVKVKANELGIRTFQPEAFDEAFINEIKALQPDILAVTAFGKIFKKDFIDVFPQGGLNVHPSLLPKYRGASPIPAALIAGETETGVSIQRLALKMDSGAILSQERYVYNGTETTEWLTDYFAHRGAELLSEVITDIENGNAVEHEQDESLATYCSYINKEDGEIDWNRSSDHIDRQLRAFTPWPGIYTFFNSKKLNIIEAEIYSENLPDTAGDFMDAAAGKVAVPDKKSGILVKTGDGFIAVKKLQLQSKKALGWKDFLNGVKDFTNTVLGGE